MVSCECGKFQFELYVKPTHSGTCLPFNSYVPTQRKQCLIISENIRARRVSSLVKQQKSIELANSRLIKNGYPENFIRKCMRHVDVNGNTRPERDEPITYLKLPYRTESQRRQIIQLARRTKMVESIRIIFTTEKPLSRQFHPKRESLKCPNDCRACKTSQYPNSCMKKHIVYEIACGLCNMVYVGQTDRTARSRILEHLTSEESHVYMHMATHGSNKQSEFKWKILDTHSNYFNRVAIEAMQIRKRSGKLMNGCQGADILPSLS